MGSFILQWVLIFGSIFLMIAVAPGIVIKSQKTHNTSSHELQGIPSYLLSAGVFSFCCGLVWLGLMLLLTFWSESDHPKGMLTLSIAFPLNAIAGVVFALVQQKLSKDVLNNPETFIAGLVGSVNVGIWVAAMTMGMVADELAPDKLRAGVAICELVGGVAAGCAGALLCGNGKLFQWILSKFSGKLPDDRPAYQGWIVGVTAGTIVSSWLCFAIAFGLANGLLAGLTAILMGWLAAMGFCLFMVPIGGFFVGMPAQGVILAIYKGLEFAQNMAWKIAGHASLPQSSFWSPVVTTEQTAKQIYANKTSVSDEPASRIQKFQHNRQQITYHLPKEWFGFLKRNAILELSPTEIRLKDTLLGMGTRWKIPVKELRSSYLTWFFDQNNPVLGINYHKNTSIISSQLRTEEIAWLIEEINEFLSTFPAQSASLHHNKPHYEKQWDERQKHVSFTFQDGLHEVKNAAAIIGAIGLMPSMLMIVPWLEEEPMETFYSFFYMFGGIVALAGGLWLLASLLKPFAKQRLEITPQQILLKRHCGKLKIGEPKQASTTLLSPSDICWLYKDKKPVLGINSEGNTFTFSPHSFKPEEMEYLLNDVRTSLSSLQGQSRPFLQKTSIATDSTSPKFPQQPSSHNLAEMTPQCVSSTETSEVTHQFIAENTLQFRIPGRLNEIIRHQIVFPLVILVFFGFVNAMMWFGCGTITESGYYIRPVLTLIWFAGLGGLIMVLQRIFGVTLLTLAPEWTEVRYELLGLGFSRRVWTTTVTGVHITHRSTINNTFDIEGCDICTEDGKKLKFGSHLPTEEKKWLLENIRNHLDTLKNQPGAKFLRQKHLFSHRKENTRRPLEAVLKLGRTLFVIAFLAFWAKSFFGPLVSGFLPEKKAADIVWETTFEKDATVTELHHDANKSYIAIGTQDAKGSRGIDAWIRAFTPQGQEIWKQVFDRQEFDSFAAIRLTLDGGYITIGSSSGVNGKNKKIWGIKLNTQGQKVWERTFERQGFDIGTPHDVQPTPDGGYLLVGEAYSRDAGHSDGWLLKIDEQGNPRWQKFLQGSPKSDELYAIRPAIDGGYLLVGHTDYSGWVVKINAEGERIWEQIVGGQDADIFSAIDLTLDENYIVAGRTRSRKSNGDFDAWVVKIDPQGQVLWEQSFGNRNWNQADAIASTPDGGYLVGGSKSVGRDGDAWLLKLNVEGNLEWERSFGGGWDDYTIYAVQAAPDRGYIAAGNKGDKAWIFKINPEKNQQE